MNDGARIPNNLAQPQDDGLRLLRETANWRSREVSYVSGLWPQVRKQIPSFELDEFRSDGEELANPYLKAVFRLPMTAFERRMPVGVVSNKYTLAQHTAVADLCIKGLQDCGFDPAQFDCQLGLSALGEWMNFRVFLPKEYNLMPTDQQPMRLRLECFNSVDGGACLELFLGWYRLICSNGLVIGKSLRRVREIHDAKLDISVLTRLVAEALETVAGDRKLLASWSSTAIKRSALAPWANNKVSDAWGKLAAFRVFHICRTGHDAEFHDPFEKGAPTEKQARMLDPVPGAANPAANLYDVSQALSWVATHRRNADERSSWQRDIPGLIAKLEAA